VTGYITKIKKILESVCHNCGKLLEDEVSCYIPLEGSKHCFW
jgi:hypothetical protein